MLDHSTRDTAPGPKILPFPEFVYIENLREEDNLSTRDKTIILLSPSVSFVWGFHCTYLLAVPQHATEVFIGTVGWVQMNRLMMKEVMGQQMSCKTLIGVHLTVHLKYPNQLHYYNNVYMHMCYTQNIREAPVQHVESTR